MESIVTKLPFTDDDETKRMKMRERENAASATNYQGHGSSRENMEGVRKSPDDTAPATDDAELVNPLTEPLEKHYTKDLRKEVYRLKLRIVRKGAEANDHKMGYIKLLRAHWRANPRVVAAETTPERGNREDVTELPEMLPLPRTVASGASEYPPPLAHEQVTSASPSPAISPVGSLDADSAQQAMATDALYGIAAGALPFEDKEKPHDVSEPANIIRAYESDDMMGGDSFDSSAEAEEGSVTSVSVFDSPAACRLEAKGEGGSAQQHAFHVASCVASVPPGDIHGSHSLDAIMRHTNYWERRLTVSKRRILELYGELQAPGPHDETDLLKDELEYYRRERKRALTYLLADRSTK